MQADTKAPIQIPIEQVKADAAVIAGQLRTAKAPVPNDLRKRFITVRAALYQRGIYDPVLVRFDSATAPGASLEEIAAQLTAIAGAL
jgi:hypothetical protein